MRRFTAYVRLLAQGKDRLTTAILNAQNTSDLECITLDSALKNVKDDETIVLQPHLRRCARNQNGVVVVNVDLPPNLKSITGEFDFDTSLVWSHAHTNAYVKGKRCTSRPKRTFLSYRYSNAY